MSATCPSVAPPPPWYRQFWPWMLIAIPAVSVLLGILMIALAVSGHDALVVDDWYKEGKSINRRIERDREADRLGLAVRLATRADGVRLDLGATHETFEPPPSLAVRWVHVTRANRDGAASFAYAGGGRYVAAGAALPESGRWRIHVEPAESGTWRLVSDVITLAPGSEPALRAARADPEEADRR